MVYTETDPVPPPFKGRKGMIEVLHSFGLPSVGLGGREASGSEEPEEAREPQPSLVVAAAATSPPPPPVAPPAEAPTPRRRRW